AGVSVIGSRMGADFITRSETCGRRLFGGTAPRWGLRANFLRQTVDSCAPMMHKLEAPGHRYGGPAAGRREPHRPPPRRAVPPGALRANGALPAVQRSADQRRNGSF